MRLINQDNSPVRVPSDVPLLSRLETGGVKFDRHWFLVCLETFSSCRTHLVRGPRRVPDDVDISVSDARYLLDQFLDLMTQVGAGGAAHGRKGHSNLHCVVVYGDAVDQTEIDNVDWYLGIVAVPEHIHYSVDGKTFVQALRPNFILPNEPNRAIRSPEPPRRSSDYKKWTSRVSKSHTCMSHEKYGEPLRNQLDDHGDGEMFRFSRTIK